jgi:hypothetical protein
MTLISAKGAAFSVALALFLLPSNLAAQDQPLEPSIFSIFASAEDRQYLSYALEGCDECGIAQIACENGNSCILELTLMEFGDSDLAAWLTENGASAKLVSASATLEFAAHRMDFSEMTGAWDVNLITFAEASALAPLAAGEAARISTARGDIDLPHSDVDAANARAFIDACAKGG